MGAIPKNVTGAQCIYFSDGMDSGSLQSMLSENQYYASMNTVHRGGVVQTRPGFTTTFGMPCGQPQGIKFFQPTGAPPYLVVAVNGFIYVSRWNNGFKEYQLLPNVRFSPLFRNVYWAVCQQFTAYDATGQLYNLQVPLNILIMQDGVSRAAYWDGQNSGHLNPTPSPNDSALSPPDFDGTPQGEWMAWEGARLWVARGTQLYASDFGNPLKFKEQNYLTNVTSLEMPGNITGMIQPTPTSPMLVFTEVSTSFVRVDIRDRAQWSTTENFITENYASGCSSGRSVIRSNGQAYWYAPQGLTNMNYASQQTIDSRFTYLDHQMAISKRYLSSDLTGICAVSVENYILVSVPSGDRWNLHTWCYDQTPLPFIPANMSTIWQGKPGWSSYWTGIRPVEWTTGIINGVENAWCLSFDRDEVNRVWQAFDGSRTDNGCPITAYVETKAHDFGNKNLKKFQFTDLHLVELLGDFDLQAGFACERGAYQPVMTKRIVATQGMTAFINGVGDYVPIQSFKTQSRYLRTQENNNRVSECNFCGVESKMKNYLGTEFSMLFVWSGRGALKDYRIFAIAGEDDEYWGKCEPDETGEHILTELGCSSLGVTPPAYPYVDYVDAATVTLFCPERQVGDPSIGMARRTSKISPLDADKRAECAAYQDALAFLRCATEN